MPFLLLLLLEKIANASGLSAKNTLPKIGLLLKNCNCQEGFFWGTAKKDLI
jgi:hypothetical protein